MRKSRILIVDDSAVIRQLLANALHAEPDLEVVGLAPDPYVARDLIEIHDPDVVTLDIAMPRMDGLTFLRQLMAERPLPVIIVSSVTQAGSAATIAALAEGAIDVIAKGAGHASIRPIAEQLKERIRALRTAKSVRLPRRPPPAAAGRPTSLGQAKGLILVGASTGGTQAIETLLLHLPTDAPPILIAQHMPAHFTRAFAARLDSIAPMRVMEASDGQPLARGTALVAPGDYHLTVKRRGLELYAALEQGPRVHFQRPSVDVLFESAVGLRGVPTVALLLTGMGADGADGMVALRQAGATTIAQDEATCVVFGMPAEAIARGGAAHVAPLDAMPRLVAQAFARHRARPGPRRQPA